MKEKEWQQRDYKRIEVAYMKDGRQSYRFKATVFFHTADRFKMLN